MGIYYNNDKCRCLQIDCGYGQHWLVQHLVHYSLLICVTQELLYGFMASGTQQLISLEIDMVGFGLIQDLGAWRKVHPKTKKRNRGYSKSRLDKLENKK